MDSRHTDGTRISSPSRNPWTTLLVGSSFLVVLLCAGLEAASAQPEVELTWAAERRSVDPGRDELLVRVQASPKGGAHVAALAFGLDLSGIIRDVTLESFGEHVSPLDSFCTKYEGRTWCGMAAPNPPGTFSGDLAAEIVTLRLTVDSNAVPGTRGTLALASAHEVLGPPAIGADAAEIPSDLGSALDLRIADHDPFVLYKIRPRPGSGRFARFGPLALIDDLGEGAYEMLKPQAVGFVAEVNGHPPFDASTGLVEYKIRRAPGGPRGSTVRGVTVTNRCGEIEVDLKAPDSMLVPAAVGLNGDAAISGGHEVEHLVCRRASGRRGLHGAQVYVSNALRSRRYDLVKLSRICSPTDVAAVPGMPAVVLSGPDRGQRKDVPDVLRRQGRVLACYQARESRKPAPLLACGGCDGAERECPPAWEPEPGPHERTGIQSTDSFGTVDSETVKEAEICLPAVAVAAG